MDYNLEALGDERFQKLSQALLTSAFPNVQCLPVGQPDGGRDAFSRHENGFIVFQVKYSRNPQVKDERIALADIIKTEGKKISALIERGATSYYLITNVSGTSHLDVGSIDKLNDELSSRFGIPCFCWWRDDVERRLEATHGLIWRYPEALRGSDFLEMFVSGGKVPLGPKKTNTLRAYLSSQYQRDSEVRFQQVQIQNSLLDLFTDTPLGVAREKVPSRDLANLSEKMSDRLNSTLHQRRFAHAYDDDPGLLAADWLLRAAPNAGLQRVVLEGAPGQGKSTVTQYLAQMNRMRTLRKDADLEKVPKSHQDHLVRIPFRVDLRDYATWLNGHNPFVGEKSASRPINSSDSLESFLAFQIYNLSGGRPFDISDLLTAVEESHCLLILDGFDEVADKSTRERLIGEIRTASERLGEDCESLQVIVTSRPAAFILSPGFPEREWLHLSLLPMRLVQISQYTDRWIDARQLSVRDGRDFKALLLDRVARSHIRSLAQNPMQLAILLSLISTKGRSLPDKRTALYDSYMDLFFGREAEKDEVVRENRDVLIQIHQYVAWTLQVEAERPGGSGSITQNDLKLLVSKFLEEKEHTGDVLSLFTGAVERVGALVSRVQGMLEFEVQPLREYFTGKYLYETAPYSPPGNEKGGTRPQRFDALARRPYWLNVARFYAGCYNSGELSSLVSGLEVLQEESSLALRSHSIQLAILFLNDWVFSQEPKTVRDVTSFVSNDANLRVLMASGASWEENRLALPEKCGRSELIRNLEAAFVTETDPDFLARIGMCLQLNTSLSHRRAFWSSLRSSGHEAFSAARFLGLFQEADRDAINELILAYGEKALLTLLRVGQWSNLEDAERNKAIASFAMSPPTLGAVPRGRTDSHRALYLMLVMLNPYLFAYITIDSNHDISLVDTLQRFGLLRLGELGELDHKEEGIFHDVISAAIRTSQRPTKEWRSDLAPWSDYVEAVRRTWGEGPRVYSLAAIAAGIRSKEVKASAYGDTLNQDLPLVERARYARLRPAVSWWKRLLEVDKTEDQQLWVLILLCSWAPSTVFKKLDKQISGTLDQLKPHDWSLLLISVRAVVLTTSETRSPLSGFDGKSFSDLRSPRVRALLSLRISKSLAYDSWMSLLSSFDGKDHHLGDFVVKNAMGAAHRETRMWKAIVGFYKTWGHIGLVEELETDFERGHYVYRQSSNSMSSVLASSVAQDCTQLPLRLLEIAERSSSRKTGLSSSPLGDVAISERWFS